MKNFSSVEAMIKYFESAEICIEETLAVSKISQRDNRTKENTKLQKQKGCDNLPGLKFDKLDLEIFTCNYNVFSIL